MSAITNGQEETHDNVHGPGMVKTIWRTFWIMLVVTIVEIIAAILYPESMPRMIVNLFFIVMSGLKAFYIVAVFMHLKFEVKDLAMTILIPFTFMLYAVAAFLYEGDSWLHMRIDYYN